MKTSDIPDRPVLEFLAGLTRWATHGKGYSMPTVQDAMPEGTPLKLQLSKMRTLKRRGLVRGCPCGCRGDWEITDAGRALIGAAVPPPGLEQWAAIWEWCEPRGITVSRDPNDPTRIDVVFEVQPK